MGNIIEIFIAVLAANLVTKLYPSTNGYFKNKYVLYKKKIIIWLYNIGLIK